MSASPLREKLIFDADSSLHERLSYEDHERTPMFIIITLARMASRLISRSLRLVSRPRERDPEALSLHQYPGKTSWLRLPFGVFVGFVIGAWLFSSNASLLRNSASQHFTSSSPIYNRTLGFEKIFAIGFEDRTDKRDGLTMAGVVTDLDITFMPGVHAETVPLAARPDGWVADWAGDGAIGCWRAHMNVIQKIVHDGIGSALILEDDTDWDISIKEQMNTFAKGALAIRNDSDTSSSPYGSDWDLLWVGACQQSEPRFEDRFYVISNDSTVPPRHLTNAAWNFHRPAEVDIPNTRLIYTPGQGVCTTGYAISQEGARRLLTAQGLRPWKNAIDRKLSRMCGQFPGESPFRCVGVYPPYFAMHRYAGSAVKDSDIWVPEDAAKQWHEEYTFNIVYSTLQNTPSLIAGNQTVKAQWPWDAAEPEISKGRRWGFEGEIRHLEVDEHPIDEDCMYCPG